MKRKVKAWKVARFRVISGLVKLAFLEKNWGYKITKRIRFYVAFLYMFFSYILLKSLDSLGINAVNLLSENLDRPETYFMIMLGGLYGSVGLWLSIMAASAFASLVPQAIK